ncbi:alpha/beta hydrolase [Salmonella enterica]|uniref:Alpha/beta hydrolase n=1 Tax=Salmonella enterica TaxID=28901 RepID=A0A5U4CNF7_SALER|nr:alpha/beta hydrolase [Salmonella enterica subsp. enterica]EBP8538950.1 alpha/beta hydrolase [Salmonella enterica]EBT4151910.1 alpha/beta hydrolase [Salmonella enterica subsp. enterica]EED9464484.1 alpha/beta hydrolase [Salmonella enterica subsp. enterica serovar Abaetetuba]EEN6707953.1 alpha/beta hydrolase [Salmonella enterica subsp. enterica serovar Rubislaw]
MHFEKHTTWLAYLWAAIAGYFTHLTLDDWGALVGIALAVATFFVNRYYKQRTAAAMDKRNQILERLAQRPESALKSLVLTSEEVEVDGGNKFEG